MQWEAQNKDSTTSLQDFLQTIKMEEKCTYRMIDPHPIAWAQSALKSLTALVLKSYLTKCYSELDEKPNAKDLYYKSEKHVAMMTKFI